MRNVFIVSPLRTPIGNFGGSLRSVPVEELAATVVRQVVQRSGIDPARIDDAVFAQSYANSETPCVGRWVALQAGLPVAVPGMQLDRRCGGGLQAIASAAMMVQSGSADVVLAGGVESMSNIEYYSTDMRWGARSGSVRLHDRLERGRERSQPEERFGPISGMIETAENLARDWGITREAADAYAVQSHQRAHAAWQEGRFADEVVPVAVPQKKGDALVVDRDEPIRADTTVEALAKLKPAFKSDGTVTAGNAPGVNDGAAAVVVASADWARRHGCRPIARIAGQAISGLPPKYVLMTPVDAVRKVLEKTGWALADVDLIELNEAFSVQAVAVIRELGLDARKVNAQGGAVALGHAIGSSGARVLTTLLYALRRTGGRRGIATLCLGGGNGVALAVERS